MEPIAITAADDPRVADYIDLRDPYVRRKLEGDEYFIAEGLTVIERLFASPYTVRSVFVTQSRFERLEPLLRDADFPSTSRRETSWRA